MTEDEKRTPLQPGQPDADHGSHHGPELDETEERRGGVNPENPLADPDAKPKQQSTPDRPKTITV